MLKISTLKKWNTDQLINRFFTLYGYSAWELVFNPHDEREMLVAMIWAKVSEAAGAVVQSVGEIYEKMFNAYFGNVRRAKIENHGSNGQPKKLTDGQVRSIRALKVQGVSYRKLAEEFNVSKKLIEKIIAREVYAGVA
jgi:hypothetical protein